MGMREEVLGVGVMAGVGVIGGGGTMRNDGNRDQGEEQEEERW